MSDKDNKKKWEQAKELAKKQGEGKNYAYIMGIYKRLTHKEMRGDNNKLKDVIIKYLESDGYNTNDIDKIIINIIRRRKND